MRLNHSWLAVATCLVAFGCGSTGGGGDAGTDSGNDSGPNIDAGRDANLPDAEPDADTDGGVVRETPRAGEFGGACRGLGECNDGLDCVAEFATTIGGPDRPIADYPPGADVPIDVVLFEGDLCTLPFVDGQSVLPCDDEACAAAGGTCEMFFADAALCFLNCDPTQPGNDICRDGYECRGDGLCVPGCAGDDECRVGVDGEGDLFYDLTSNAFCDRDSENPTFACFNPGAPDAEIGDPCVNDNMCTAGGRCLEEDTFDFLPGGYCSEIFCSTNDDCPGDSSCWDRFFSDASICAADCTVGEGIDPEDPATWIGPGVNEGCREGYGCSPFGDINQAKGVCFAENPTDVTEPNIGFDCSDDTECYSPLGEGTCRDDLGLGCVVQNCAHNGMPDGTCGDDAVCVVVTADNFSLCLANCETAEDCLPGSGCVPLDGEDAGNICFFCAEDAECRKGETCDDQGTCVAP